MEQLRTTLQRIDGRGYRSYKDLQGAEHRLGRIRLYLDHIQGDPYASPSRLRALVPADLAALPEWSISSADRRRATRDLVARVFRNAARDLAEISIDAGAQTVLDRSACLIQDGRVELRFTVNLPANGRRILGRRAFFLLGERLPEIIERCATAPRLDLTALKRHCAVVEDQVALRQGLAAAGLVAFVADGAVLPRRSGIDDRAAAGPVTWQAPASLRVSLTAPNAGQVSGLGIRHGITLIVGGGFHGKSTLLRAIATGIDDHIPGDGREQVVTDTAAVKIRAEDGRAVTGVDISAFINHLPFAAATSSFTTELASGSTSQAAALVEALEAGARALLVDEDTSATNFMIRDRRMQALVAKAQEPITPFVDRIAALRDRLGIATVLVMGGSGDYFDQADTVIQMADYRPLDVTSEAHEIAHRHQTGRCSEHESALAAPQPRRLDPASLQPELKPGRPKIQARGVDSLVLGRDTIDLRAVEQLTDPSQVRAIGWLLAGLAGHRRGPVMPIPILAQLLERLAAGEWQLLNGRADGDLALPRLHEVMAALNRLRGVRFGG